MLRRNGFTLAEVLITLGIIGVVAAMTIPTLLQNADERALIVALKRSYSILSQAYKLTESEYGTPDNWGLSLADTPEVLTVIGKSLKITRDCTDGSKGCWPKDVVYKMLDGNVYMSYDDFSRPKVALVDGSLIFAHVLDETCQVAHDGVKDICARYDVDVNGAKGPNRWGRDVFFFYLTKNGIVPTGTPVENVGWYSFSGFCNNQNDGEGCTAWVIYNDNMGYMHCPGTLDWNGKTKCN